MTSLHFTDITPVRRARRLDPATSHAAAQKVGKFANSHAERILHAIQVLKIRGPSFQFIANQNTISKASGLTVAQVSKRLGEMERAGLIAVEQRDGADWVVDGQRCWRAI
jgi:CRP-like cAMP-binding protein